MRERKKEKEKREWREIRSEIRCYMSCLIRRKNVGKKGDTALFETAVSPREIARTYNVTGSSARRVKELSRAEKAPVLHTRVNNPFTCARAAKAPKASVKF